jgi:outer membrane protein assembly factor BamB
MSKRVMIPVVLCAVAAVFGVVRAAKRKKPSAPAVKVSKFQKGVPVMPHTDGEDVLKDVLAANSANYPAPPTQFRAGHVTPRALDGKMFVKTANGFTIQFPSHAPIVTPTVHEGIVLTSGGFHSREFYAFEARSGKPLWAIDLDDDGPSVAACEGELCAFNTESCTLFVVDVKTGKMRWSVWLGDPLTSAPTIKDGRVFTSYPAHGHTKASHVLAAFDLKSGQIMWQRWLDADVMSAPVAIGDELYATTFNGTLYDFDARSGAIHSARRVRATSAPTVAGNDVLYSRRTEAEGQAAAETLVAEDKTSKVEKFRARGKVAAYLDSRVQAESHYTAVGKSLDASNGFAGGAPTAANPQAAMGTIGKTSVSTMQAHQGSRVLRVKDRNVSSMGDELVSTGKDGKVLWSVKLDGDVARDGGALAAPPAAAGSSLVVATLDGQILQVEADGGKVQSRFKVGAPLRSQPAVMDGWVYAGSEDGKLIAVDTGDRKLTGWSSWGGDAQRTGVR